MDVNYRQMVDTITAYATNIRTGGTELRIIYLDLINRKTQYETNVQDNLLLNEFVASINRFKTSYFALINTPRPETSMELNLKIDKIINRDNQPVLDQLQLFEEIYTTQENIVLTEFRDIKSALIGDVFSIEEEYITKHDNAKLNKTNIDRHFTLLRHANDLKNRKCAELPAGSKNPAGMYELLRNVTYTNIVTDNNLYISISCCVSNILQRYKHHFLKHVNSIKDIPIESEKFPIVISPVLENIALSDTSAEGDVWAVRYLDFPTPFAVMKYGKRPIHPVVYNKNNYNIIHELVVGMVLNTIRHITPNFMYIWGAFSCSIPTVTGRNPNFGNIAYQDHNLIYKYDYETLCSSTDPKSSEFIMLSEIANDSCTFYDFMKKSSRIPNFGTHLINILLQLMCTLTIAQSNFRFVHGDLHQKNILIKTLITPVNLTYTISKILFEDPITVEIQNVTYIVVIIDYGISRLNVGGTIIKPLYYNHNWTSNVYGHNVLENLFFNEENMFLPLYDIARALTGSFTGFPHTNFGIAFKNALGGKVISEILPLRPPFDRVTIEATFSDAEGINSMYEITKRFYQEVIIVNSPLNNFYTGVTVYRS